MPADLVVDARLRAGAFHLDVALVLERGPLLLVGPNGGGKSTLLRALAGGPVDVDGTVTVRGEPWVEAGRALPPEARRVGFLPQGLGLFPHLTALDNAAFGASGPTPRQRATAWLERLGAGALLSRRPGSLSGGEQQRVALARALAADPAVLLLDEPLAAVDVRARTSVRAVIAEALGDAVGVIATHDPLDLVAWAGRVAVVEGHRVSEPLSLEAARDHGGFLAALFPGPPITPDR